MDDRTSVALVDLLSEISENIGRTAAALEDIAISLNMLQSDTRTIMDCQCDVADFFSVGDLLDNEEDEKEEESEEPK